MASSRDDFVIAIRSAFLKKSYQQKFSLLTLIFLSLIVIILGSFNFKAIQYIKIGVNEIVYRSSFIASIPENYFEDGSWNLYWQEAPELLLNLYRYLIQIPEYQLS